MERESGGRELREESRGRVGEREEREGKRKVCKRDEEIERKGK